MIKTHFTAALKPILVVILLFLSSDLLAQYQSTAPNAQNDFWDKVQYGGAIGLSFGNNYTEVSLAPTAIYNINEIVAVGLSLQGSYVSSKNYYNSYIYGASVIGLINPIPQIQLSAELIQARVNNEYEYTGGTSYQDNFWNTALLVGGGYRTGNITIGVTYNVLYDTEKEVYGDAFMPFVRAYF